MSPIISVVIPTYNRAQYVSCAIDSVLSQAPSKCEVIVVDDGSTDNTREVLSRYKGAITCCYQENAGVSAARNRGVHLAQGEWLNFLDSDDEWLPNFLSLQRMAVKQHPGIVASVMNVLALREHGSDGTIFGNRGLMRELGGRAYVVDNRPLLKIVEHDLAPILLGSLLRRDVFGTTKGFNPALRIAEDLDLVGKMALKGPFLFGVEPVAKLLRREESIENLTAQLYQSATYTRECLQTVYEGFAASDSLTSLERSRLRRIMSQNQRSLGNLHMCAGRNDEAKVYYRRAVRTHFSPASVGRVLLSLLPTRVLLQTIRKGTQIQPDKLDS